MLGVLLLGTQILFVSASWWRKSYVTSSETCSELLKSWNNETFIYLYWSPAGGFCFNEEYESGGYNFNVTFDLGLHSEIYEPQLDLRPACFGVPWVMIQSAGREGKKGRAMVFLETEPVILVGGVSGSLAYCTGKKCPFHLSPGLMETAPLQYSPLTREFWTTFNDSNIFNKAWIWLMHIRTIQGNIPSQWVSHLASDFLKYLIISGNDWRRPGKLLGCLPNLEYLELRDNNIELLSNDTFSGTPSLKLLTLSGNRLLHLSFSLENHRRPLIFQLENQRGRSEFQISDSDLPYLKKISLIDLRNVTVRIDFCNISEEANVSVIQVVNSKILSGWKEEIYCTGSIKSKTYLILCENNLSVLPSNLMKRMINTIYLNVSSNNLTDCQQNVIGILSKLTNLYMDNNHLRKLTVDCFQTLGDLESLSLSNNEIMSIEGSTFVSLVRLRYLSLLRNKLVSIEKGTFSGLIKLKTLDLSFNKLINIDYSIFLSVGMEKLFIRYLKLSNNKLNEVILSTKSIAHIKELDLSNNSIRKIEIRNVEVLNLSYNSLDLIPGELVTNPENFTVDFGGNNLACCHPNNFMLAETRMTLYNLGTREHLYCVLNDHKIVLQAVLLNTTLCVKQKSDSTSYMELWVSLGVLTVFALVFTSFVYYYRTELAYLSIFAEMLKKGIRTDEQKYDDAAYDAFVCYCGKNLDWTVKHLLGTVEGTDEGYRLCVHDRDFTLGAAIVTNVLAALNRSRKVIFVLSPDFMSSKWCRRELEMATHKMFEEERNYIILIELESLKGVVLAKQLKFLMKNRTYLHWPGDSASEEKTAEFWEGLRQALGPSLFCKTGKQLPRISVLDIEE